MNRRSFLKNSSLLAVLGQSGYLTLLDSMARSAKARATGEGAEGLNYIAFELTGGPPRWHFDLPLNPNGRSGDFKAGGFGTELAKISGEWKAVYRPKPVTFGGKSVYLPPLWRLNCASTGTALKSLLPHTVMIRGIDMEINNHQLNRTRSVRPFATEPSTTGLIADRSLLPFPSVGHNVFVTSALNSPGGINAVKVSPTNPVPGMLSPFGGTYADKDGVSDAEEAFLQAASTQAIDSGYYFAAASKTRKSAQELFLADLKKYEGRFKSLLKKYSDIVSKNYLADFPGITANAKLIKPKSTGEYQVVRGRYLRSSTLFGALNKAEFPRLAHSFALAELLVTERLSSVVTLGLDGNSLRKGTGFSGVIPHDQHGLGAINSCFFTSLYFRAITGCLTEFVSQLKASGLFEKSLIHLISEFNRNPRLDASGSDHGFKGSNTTFISGMIKEPGLIGNIQKIDPNKRVASTWGLAAPTTGLGRTIVNDDIVNSVCEMMEVPKITSKGQSLVKKSGNGVQFRQKWGHRNVS